jgi:hypothetical protein
MIRIVDPASWIIKEEQQISLWSLVSAGVLMIPLLYLAGHGSFCPSCSGQQHDRQLPACWRRENAGLAQHIVKYGRSCAEVGSANGN